MLPPYTQSVTQLTLDLDEETARQIDEAAARAGQSVPEWARKTLQTKLEVAPEKKVEDRWPDWWLANLGTWEDDRTVEEIIADIDNVPPLEDPGEFQPLPESWFAVLGTLEDSRTAEEIIADIDNVPPQRARVAID